MRTLRAAACTAAILLLAQPAHAANRDCAARAEEKRITGTSRVQFLKKCEKDASGGVSAMCQKAADAKKLNGATRARELKSCLARNKDG